MDTNEDINRNIELDYDEVVDENTFINLSNNKGDEEEDAD